MSYDYRKMATSDAERLAQDAERRALGTLIDKKLRKDVGAVSVRNLPAPPGATHDKRKVTFPSGAVVLIRIIGDTIILDVEKWLGFGNGPGQQRVEFTGRPQDSYAEVAAKIKAIGDESVAVTPPAELVKPEVDDLIRSASEIESALGVIKRADQRWVTQQDIARYCGKVRDLAQQIADEIGKRTPAS